MQIGADIAGLRSGVDQANAKVESFATKATSAFKMVGASAVFGAIASGIGMVVAAADEIDTIGSRIDDTAENVQRLQAVAQEFDTEMGSIVGAIQEMQKRIGNGEIEKGLGAINIKVEDFVKMSPTEQFLAAANAIGQVEDPSKRAALGQDIFGKSVRGVSGALRDGVDAQQAYAAMSSETIAKIDEMGNTWARLKAHVVAATAAVITHGQGDIYKNRFEDNTPALPGTPFKSVVVPPGVVKDYEAIEKALDKSVAHSIKQNTEAQRLAKHQKDIEESFRASVAYFAPLVKGYQTIAVTVQDTRADVEEVRESMEAMAGIDFNTTWAPFVQGAKDAGDLTEDVRRKMARLASWKDIGATLSNAIMGAIQGGGDVGKSLGGAAGQMLGTKLGTSIGDWAGKAVGGALGSAIGGAAGSVLPVVGTMLGSVAGSMIGKMFGGGEGKQVNDLRDKFVSAAGGIHELNLKAQAAGLTLDSLLSAKKVSDFEAAVLKLNAAFAEEEAMTQRGIAAMDKYGITIEQAGAKFKQTQMNATAEDLVKDFQGLVAVGVDMDTIIEKMGGSVGEFVHRSIEMGTSVPREMQGIIAKMIESGTLLDKNGEKFTDISQIPFADSLNDGMSKLIAKLDQMLDRIGVQLPNALNKVPRTIDIDVTERRRRVWDGGDGDYTPMAAGGIVRRPTFALVGEAGPEAVIPLSKLGAMGGGGGGETHIHLHNAQFDGYASAQQAARQILGALTGEQERRGQSLAFAGA